MTPKPAVLFAVLNWGLGHATRSIPIITALLNKGFTVHIASDGYPLELLTKKFPNLPAYNLPALSINYTEKGKQTLAVILQSTALKQWYQADKKAIGEILNTHNFSGIISDNRPGAFSKSIPSAYITHQLHLKTGLATPLAGFAHKMLYKHFSEIWIPDEPMAPGLAGDLSHKHNLASANYIGPLSDLKSIQAADFTNDIAIILSGPEPQRSALEKALINQLANSEKRILLLRGTKRNRPQNIPVSWRVRDLATRDDVQDAFTKSETIIARNGYSTLMDLSHFPKPALLIPTPGQPEQEYLATLETHILHCCIERQNEISLESGLLEAEEKFKRRQSFVPPPQPHWEKLFSLFKGK